MKVASRIHRVLEVLLLTVTLGVGNALAAPVLSELTLNAWALPLMYCAERSGVYDIDIDMGFVNTDYACRISREEGVQFDTRTHQPIDEDAARWVLNAVNHCQRIQSFRLQTGVSRDSQSQLQALLQRLPDADIRIGKEHGKWSAPVTHTKVFQLADLQAGLYFTVHGSLNLQTVGLSCKANNALRFVEAAPARLHAHFKELANAVAANSAKGMFDGRGTAVSSGVGIPEVAIGDYRVGFYAGRAQGFVGVAKNDDMLPWPTYLNPPVAGRHAPGIVHWYDGVLYEAARQLQEGREVHLDVLMFEIGQNSAFVNHLWRFVREGFAGGVPIDGVTPINETIKGRLQVRFLWQFQSHPDDSSLATANLNRKSVIDTPGPEGGYHLQTGRIWPRFGMTGQVVPPTTPYDMHNKFVLMTVPTHPEENRIFVASSNLDEPGVGSGRLWQAGTVIRSVALPPEQLRDRPASIFQAYQDYFDRLWRNRHGEPNAGQVAFYEEITALHRSGRVNWIETTAPGSDAGVNVMPGIDAFFFPISIEAP